MSSNEVEERRRLEVERREARMRQDARHEEEEERRRREAVHDFMGNYYKLNESIEMNCRKRYNGTMTADRERFEMRLKTKLIFNDCCDQNMDIISMCTTQIMENVFYGKQHLIQFIIDNASKEQLNKIYNTIKDVTLQYDINQKNDTQSQPNYFNILSDSSVINIFSFLSRKDIINMKSVSLEFSIIALEEMKKYSLYVLNMNNMITDTVKRHKFNNVFHDIASDSFLFDEHRYYQTQLMKNCFNEWFMKYSISSQHAIIIPFKTANYTDSFIDQIGDRTVDDLANSRTSYLLFDCRSVIRLNNNDNFCSVTNTETFVDNGLVILYYYDIHKKCMFPLQFLLISDTKISDIEQYIKNRFIAKTNFQKIWYNELKKQILQQNEWKKHHKDETKHCFKFYKKSKTKYKTFAALNHCDLLHDNVCIENTQCGSLIFQLDTANPYFDVNYAELKQHGIATFYDNYIQSLYLTIKCNLDEIDAIKWRLNAIVNDNKLIHKVNEFECGKTYLLSKNTTIDELKNKISMHFDNKVQSKNIQLFCDDLQCIPSFEKIRSISQNRMNWKDIRFSIVSYDATDFVCNDEKERETQPFKYKIKVFLPNQCGLPLIKPTDVDTNIMIQYKKKFVCVEFMKDLIGTMKHPLYTKQFKEIVKIYNKYNENTEVELKEDENVSNDIEIVLQMEDKLYCMTQTDDGTLDLDYTERNRIESYLRFKRHKDRKIRTPRKRKKRRLRTSHSSERKYMNTHFPEYTDSCSSTTSSDSSTTIYTLKEQLNHFDKAASIGQLFLRHPLHHDVILRVTYSNTYRPLKLLWGTDSNYIEFSDILYIAWGLCTKTFIKKKEMLDAKLCFSVVSKQKILDLQALNEEVAELWVKGLTKMIGQTTERAQQLAKAGMECWMADKDNDEMDDVDDYDCDIFSMEPYELDSYYKYIAMKDCNAMSNVFDVSRDEYSAKRMIGVNVFFHNKYLNTKTHQNDIEVCIQFVVLNEIKILKKVGFKVYCWGKFDETVKDLLDRTQLKKCEKCIVNMEVVQQDTKSTVKIKPESYKPKTNDIFMVTLRNIESDACKMLYCD